MHLLTYVSSPKELGEQCKFEFYIHDVMRWEPNFVTSKCFKNKYVYSFDSVLHFCPYKTFQQRDVDDDGNIITEAKKEKLLLEWKHLCKTSLASRAALVSFINQHLSMGEFFEMYSLWWGMGTPDILPEPQHITILNVNELQESRDFVLNDGHKFIIYR